jgi:pimeloyl-ACP methyl ester carboxylesterase
MKYLKIAGVVLVLIAAAVAGIAATQLPAIGAGALLFPHRTYNTRPLPEGCAERKFAGVDVMLDGWECKTPVERRGTIVYLHGIADNRGSSVGTIGTFLPIGFDVIAYDARAHGTSQGEHCTYGFYEKRDLQRVIDQLGVSEVVLVGHSLGGAIALQAAAVEPRVRAVIASATFSDLRTIATERAYYMPSWSIGPAFARAEQLGRFAIDEASAIKAAGQIQAPVLLLHGARDGETPPSHSERVFHALRGKKQLIIVPDSDHNNVLTQTVWRQVVDWLLPVLS